MNLSNLRSPKGARRNTKRLGRGESSGRGKTAGRGHKGQGSRSGSKTGAQFEGGQNPMFRRLPKFGFTPRNKVVSAVVNLKDLEGRFDSGTTVDRTTLVEKGLLKKSYEGPIKILATGAIKKKLTVKASAFSAKAMTAIQGAGGTAEVVK